MENVPRIEVYHPTAHFWVLVSFNLGFNGDFLGFSVEYENGFDFGVFEFFEC